MRGKVVRARALGKLTCRAADMGARAELSLSDCDPALSQLGEAAPCDVRILFLDWRLNKLAPAQAASFIRERAREAARAAPVLLNKWPGSRELNVPPSSLLFVDDNSAELAKARGAVEGLRVLLADADGAQTAAALDHF